MRLLTRLYGNTLESSSDLRAWSPHIRDEIKLVEMATHGSLSAFDPSKEDWTSYTDRMKHYFIANVTDSDRKRSILLSACGASTFKLIQNLVEKDKMNTTSFEDIVAKLKTHYDPEPSVIMQI